MNQTKKTSSFMHFHPIVIFSYLLAMLVMTMLFMHPVMIGISFGWSFFCCLQLCGFRELKKSLRFLVPLFVLTALLNPTFNHAGVTVLTYLPTGNPLTLEALLYGVFTGFVFLSVVLWFFCLQRLLDSDKVIYLFGRIAPSVSLVFSMILSFVPRLKQRLSMIISAQKAMGRDPGSGTLKERVKRAIGLVSVLLTWSMESAVTTADSMKSRGYGLKGRTHFSIYSFSKRDAISLFFICVFSIYIFVFMAKGELHYAFYPFLTEVQSHPLALSVYAVYFLLCSVPILAEERRRRK